MTGFALKLLAILTMVADHVGYVFFPRMLGFRILGRIALPLFAFMAAEGARYTHDRKRYLLRLLLWGVLSEIPFDLMCHGVPFSPITQNVCFTLAAGVACTWLLEQADAKGLVVVCAILGLVFLLNTDYGIPGALAVVILHHFIGKKQPVRGMLLACTILSLGYGLLQIFCFLAIIPILFYRGKRGPQMKYFFYIFYPLHMLVLWGIAQYLMLN